MILATIAWLLFGAVLFLLALYTDLRREVILLRRQFSLYRCTFKKDDFIKDCGVYSNLPGDQ